MSGLAYRQTALYERQLNAVAQLWEAFISLSPVESISGLMAQFQFEKAAKEASKNTEFRKRLNELSGGFDIKKLKTVDARKIRPFVSHLSWALYSAYRAVVFYAALQLHMLQEGIAELNLLNSA